MEVSVKEIVYTKVWSYRKSVSIRLICSFWMITVMITIFASIMRLQNCSFPFLKYVTVTILYAVFLGILGLLFSQLGNNVIIGYLASLGLVFLSIRYFNRRKCIIHIPDYKRRNRDGEIDDSYEHK